MAGLGAILSFTGIMLGLVLGLYALALWLRRRFGLAQGTLPPTALPVVGRRNLDRNRAIFVVRVADRYILLGGAEQSVSMLDHISADEYDAMCADELAGAERAAGPNAFTSMFERAREFHAARSAASTTAVESERESA